MSYGRPGKHAAHFRRKAQRECLPRRSEEHYCAQLTTSFNRAFIDAAREMLPPETIATIEQMARQGLGNQDHEGGS